MKEKLVELLEETQYCPHMERDGITCDMCEWNDAFISCRSVRQADHLIANGVTVQRWIPVRERLPNDGEKVLVAEAFGGAVAMGIYEQNVGWWHPETGDKFDDWSWEITHWMRFPNLPKEDE